MGRLTGEAAQRKSMDGSNVSRTSKLVRWCVADAQYTSEVALMSPLPVICDVNAASGVVGASSST